MKLYALLLLAVMTAASSAQAPPQILDMQNLPNAGQLYLDYCGIGNPKPCVRVKAICYGQCCSQYDADDMGYGCSGDVERRVPRGYRYTGWSCTIFDSGKKITGKADPNYPTKGCHNPRFG